ncbi:hypothetical protein NDU88_000733 [Pleurodeles waltl]|uniref:Uncharacterized protein n=1 Tax=Pleurodeles waltl TaxID=8319 RepID=A0AAV7S620_PLEWA|nr:hypothetical protein NDU88_000733 [Pleurodeles waltl]
MGETVPPTTLDIKSLILEGNNAITEKIDGLDITVALMHQDMEKMRERVKDLGIRTDSAKEILGAHTSRLADQEWCLKQQEAKMADLEDRSPRNNVCMLEVPEDMETTPIEKTAGHVPYYHQHYSELTSRENAFFLTS